MKVTLESTSVLVEIEVATGGLVPARVWEGISDEGVACYALITRIAVHKDDDAAAFERDLQAHKPPSSRAIEVFPSRLVL